MFIERGKVYQRSGSGDPNLKGFENLQTVRVVQVKKNENSEPSVLVARLQRPGGWFEIPKSEFVSQYHEYEEAKEKLSKSFSKRDVGRRNGGSWIDDLEPLPLSGS